MKPKVLSQVSHNRLELHEEVPLATPMVVYIEPSGYCNLKCGFCPHGVPGSDLKKDLMSYELFRKLIDDIGSFPGRPKLLRICGNGEPLMNKFLVDMLRYAREQEVSERIEMLTNGLLLSPDTIRYLPECLDRIIISIEGLCAEDYLRISGAKMDFKKFLGSLDALFTARKDCIVHHKIHHEAVPSQEKEREFHELFEGRCDEIFIERLVPMWPQLDSAYSSHEFRFSDDPVRTRRVCAQIFKGVQVQADGEVVPCCVDWKRVNVLGDLRTESLFDIWNGPRMKRMQLQHLSGNKPNLEPCRDCTMNDYCEVDNLDDHAEECLRSLAEKRV
jgi:radical SAM protein with 4Fe4S-binding SPASM domain